MKGYCATWLTPAGQHRVFVTGDVTDVVCDPQDKMYGSVVMCGVTMYNRSIIDRRMDHALFSQCSFRRCRFSGVAFDRATFQDVVFDNCILDEVSFAGCTIDGLFFPSSTLKRCSFRGAYMRRVFCNNGVAQGAGAENIDTEDSIIVGGNGALLQVGIKTQIDGFGGRRLKL